MTFSCEMLLSKITVQKIQNYSNYSVMMADFKVIKSQKSPSLIVKWFTMFGKNNTVPKNVSNIIDSIKYERINSNDWRRKGNQS